MITYTLSKLMYLSEATAKNMNYWLFIAALRGLLSTVKLDLYQIR